MYEVITGVVANFWYQHSVYRYKEADLFKNDADLYWDAATIYQILSDSMKVVGRETLSASFADTALQMETRARENEEYSALLRFDAKNARYKMYNALSMLVGGYIFNIFSGVGNSRYFITDSEKSPVKAAWLSAIPPISMYQVSRATPGFGSPANTGVRSISGMGRFRVSVETGCTLHPSISTAMSYGVNISGALRLYRQIYTETGSQGISME